MSIPPPEIGRFLKLNPPLKTFAKALPDFPNMKTPLPPLIQSHLAEVGNIADGLAATACQVESGKMRGLNVAGVLDNLDDVASALTWADLENAPAMLNAAARAFRQTFPSDSLGWEDAARLTLIAYAIERGQVDNYMKENPGETADFYFKKENPFSTL
jgi:hypothetical protein